MAKPIIEDMLAMRDSMENAIAWSFVESEGQDVIRFDWGYRSVWIYQWGDIDGLETFPKPYQKRIKQVVSHFVKEQ